MWIHGLRSYIPSELFITADGRSYGQLGPERVFFGIHHHNIQFFVYLLLFPQFNNH